MGFQGVFCDSGNGGLRGTTCHGGFARPARKATESFAQTDLADGFHLLPFDVRLWYGVKGVYHHYDYREMVGEC